MSLDPKTLSALAVRLHGRRIGVINRIAGELGLHPQVLLEINLAYLFHCRTMARRLRLALIEMMAMELTQVM